MVVQYGSKMKSGMKPFRFSNMWTEHPRFLEVVKEAWTAEVRGNPTCNLFLKVEKDLRPAWSKKEKHQRQSKREQRGTGEDSRSSARGPSEQ